jgi:hypothetical protein
LIEGDDMPGRAGVERVHGEQCVRGEVYVAVMWCAMKASRRSIGNRMGLRETVEGEMGEAQLSRGK